MSREQYAGPPIGPLIGPAHQGQGKIPGVQWSSATESNNPYYQCKVMPPVYLQ